MHTIATAFAIGDVISFKRDGTRTARIDRIRLIRGDRNTVLVRYIAGGYYDISLDDITTSLPSLWYDSAHIHKVEFRPGDDVYLKSDKTAGKVACVNINAENHVYGVQLDGTSYLCYHFASALAPLVRGEKMVLDGVVKIHQDKPLGDPSLDKAVTADRSGEAPTAALRRNEYVALPTDNPTSGFGWQVAFITSLGRVSSTPYFNIPGKKAAEFLAAELNDSASVKPAYVMPKWQQRMAEAPVKPWNPFDVYQPLATGQQAKAD